MKDLIESISVSSFFPFSNRTKRFTTSAPAEGGVSTHATPSKNRLIDAIC